MSKITMLEKYQHTLADLKNLDSPMSIEVAWVFQELLYRIEVLQVCQMFTTTAPTGDDERAMILHYQMVDIYFENLKCDRRHGPPASDQEQDRRNTAHQSLCRVVNDYRKQFGSFRASTPEQYKNEIRKVIAAFLPVWIQTRNTYINIMTKETTA